MTADLAASALHHARLRDELKEVYALSDDDPALVDTLDGISDFKELAQRVALYALEADAMAEGLGGMIEKLVARQARFIEKGKRLRAALKQAMLEAGEKKITMPGVTVYTGAGRQKMVYRVTADEAPDKFCRIKREFDAAAVRAALVSGDADAESVAFFGNAEPTLTIKAS